jgi:hypothetical protein
MEIGIDRRVILNAGGIMKSKSKRARSPRTPVQQPRNSRAFEDSSHGRLARRGSTGLTEDRPHRRGSSDTASDPS